MNAICVLLSVGWRRRNGFSDCACDTPLAARPRIAISTNLFMELPPSPALAGAATFYLSWLFKLSEVIRRGMPAWRAHAPQLFGRNGVKKVSTLATGNCLWLAPNIGDLWLGVRRQRSVASVSAYGQI